MSESPNTAPSHLGEDVRQVWEELVAVHDSPSLLAGSSAFEAYCSLVATLRKAHAEVAESGQVVEDARGRLVAHPAIEIERRAAAAIAAFGDRFESLEKPARKRGYMADATARSIKAATHLSAIHDGPVAAVKTIAWLIDEAQRSGLSDLQRTAFGALPIYLKACESLQITPASVPATKTRRVGGRGGLAVVRGESAAG